LTIDNIDDKYYKEILDNKAQLTEWENLFSIKVKTIADLKAQPTLVLDTKFFKQNDGSNPFKDKILAEIENLDERTNGLLINSENYQALSILEDKYRGKIKCNYIDPPYNAKSSSIIYKNHFKHSSWASFMFNRLQKGSRLLNNRGIQITAIDENEHENLGLILDEVFPNYSKTCVSVIHNPGGIQGDNFAYSHEYAYFVYPRIKRLIGLENREDNADVRNFMNTAKGNTTNYLRTSGANCFYPVIIEDGEVIGFGDVCEDDYHPTANVQNDDGTISVYPIDADGVERKWVFARQSVEEIQDDLSVEFNEQRGVYEIIRTKSELNYKTVWTAKKYNAKSNGTSLLTNILGKSNKFSFPKSLYLVVDCIDASTHDQNDAIILDYFAGSGTTGHAVIYANKNNDESKKKYILVEMGKYFDDVTKVRIQKVIYSLNWKKGKPLDNNGSKNHIFKYIVLEQYEDMLDAIEQFEGATPKNLPLKYLYKPELNKINSTLDLSKPFSNKIKYGQPTKEGFVDLVDTYNYLQGYELKSIKPYTIGKKYYKVVETADTLVIWRDIALGEDDSKAIKEIAEKYPEATQIEVNYDFNILATLKDKQLEVGKRLLGLSVIHADIFNQ